MKPFERVLCAVDFSDTSREALRYATMLAQCSGGELHIAHATYFEPPLYFTHGQMEELRHQAEHSRSAAEDALRKFAAEAGAGTQHVHLADGPAADVIVALAATLGAHLIVMGTHGRTGLNRLMLGSVAEKLMRMSPVPVLAVRTGTRTPEVRHILCPVNNTPMARSALMLASGMAACTNARLTALHVRESDDAATIEDICAWIAREPLPGSCDVRDLTREGDAATEIIRTAQDMRADLIVLGASHKRFFDASVLGSTTVRVTRHAPVPVLVAFTADGQDSAQPALTGSVNEHN